ncbi:phage tail family protein [Aerococcaceae bacterium zg-ZJ1578]|uniref:distal tail protein Dit n=1 Tax=Aerococcaceae bacterium zg-252 TaxID=2796928 RepID=UPI001A34F4D0|nr:phage tail family protein [Aerococcaceae bacterium zg-1578]MBR7928477.1 phage tail family protein [Aerococcaceae bacterium zg-ZUI334]
MAYFKFNGVSSKDMGLRIMNQVVSESTGRDIERVQVPGRDGDLLLSNNRLKSVEKSFPCKLIVKDNLTMAGEKISQWLLVDGYKDLELSWDANYLYKAAFIETFAIEEILRQFGEVKLNFLVYPVKFLKTSLVSKSVRNGEVITNSGNVKAKPIIKLIGNGECVLTINNRKTKVINVQNNLVLDMQKNMVYSGAVTAAWDKVVRSPEYMLPYLDVGSNTISWTGNFTVEMTTYVGVKL